MGLRGGEAQVHRRPLERERLDQRQETARHLARPVPHQPRYGGRRTAPRHTCWRRNSLAGRCRRSCGVARGPDHPILCRQRAAWALWDERRRGWIGLSAMAPARQYGARRHSTPSRREDPERLCPGHVDRQRHRGVALVLGGGPAGVEVYRCRPEEGMGLCRHVPGRDRPEVLAPAASIAPPVLLRNCAVYGSLDGKLYVVPLSGEGKPWSFATAFGKAISAPPCVCDRRIYFGCEDGYLYALGLDGNASLPTEDPQVWKIRSPLGGTRATRSSTGSPISATSPIRIPGSRE